MYLFWTANIFRQIFVLLFTTGRAADRGSRPPMPPGKGENSASVFVALPPLALLYLLNCVWSKTSDNIWIYFSLQVLPKGFYGDSSNGAKIAHVSWLCPSRACECLHGHHRHPEPRHSGLALPLGGFPSICLQLRQKQKGKEKQEKGEQVFQSWYWSAQWVHVRTFS